MPTLQDKIDLMRKYNMTEALSKLRYKLEVEELTAMNFPPITEKQIKNKLRGFRFLIWHGWNALRFSSDTREGLTKMYSFFAMILITFGWVIAGFITKSAFEGFVWATGIWTALFTIIPMVKLAHAIGPVQIGVVSLSGWEGGIPMGALLAVQEAEAKGLSGFQVHYPKRRDEVVLNLDPIITAHYKYNTRNRFKVFEWNDGILYQEKLD